MTHSRTCADSSVDRRAAAALEPVLSGCDSTKMIVTESDAGAWEAPHRTASARDALSLCDNNGNGRITCREARTHGIAALPRGHPAYPFAFERDGDGIVCE